MAYLFLLFYISVVFIRPHEWFAVQAESPIIRIAVMLTFVTYLITQENKKLPPQVWLICLMAIVIAISSALNGWAGGAIHYMMRFLPASLLPIIICGGLLTSIARQKGIMVICLIATMFIVHNGYEQFQSYDGSGWAAGTYLVEKTRITYVGIFGDPNDIAMFLVMTIPFAAYFVARSGFFLKVVFFTVLCLLVYGVTLTNSRGGLLGLFSLAGTFFVYRYGIKKAIFAGIVTVPLVVIIMSTFRAIEQGESANGRVDAWFIGMHELFLHNPIFGVGYNQFVEHHTHTAHNSFVLVIAELGIAGYFLWLSSLVLSILMVARTVKWYRDIPDEKKKEVSEQIKTEVDLSTVLTFSFVGYLTTCFFLSRSYVILLFIFMGMAIASYYRVIKLVPELEIVNFGPYLMKTFKLTIVSVIFFFIVVKLLL
jgi:putative inorganic carbon (HCO3(-)) transporter